MKEKNLKKTIVMFQLVYLFLIIIFALTLSSVFLPHMQPGDMIKISARVSVVLLVFFLVFFLLTLFIIELLMNKISKLTNEEIVEGMNYQKIGNFQNKGVEYSIVRPILGSVDLITTSESAINDLGDGEFFFKKSKDQDNSISEIVVIKLPQDLLNNVTWV